MELYGRVILENMIELMVNYCIYLLGVFILFENYLKTLLTLMKIEISGAKDFRNLTSETC